LTFGEGFASDTDKWDQAWPGDSPVHKYYPPETSLVARISIYTRERLGYVSNHLFLHSCTSEMARLQQIGSPLYRLCLAAESSHDKGAGVKEKYWYEHHQRAK